MKYSPCFCACDVMDSTSMVRHWNTHSLWSLSLPLFQHLVKYYNCVAHDCWDWRRQKGKALKDLFGLRFFTRSKSAFTSQSIQMKDCVGEGAEDLMKTWLNFNITGSPQPPPTPHPITHQIERLQSSPDCNQKPVNPTEEFLTGITPGTWNTLEHRMMLYYALVRSTKCLLGFNEPYSLWLKWFFSVLAIP